MAPTAEPRRTLLGKMGRLCRFPIDQVNQ